MKVIGFTEGTFDMFHVGHLNLLKNAKSCCDYLIVGVNTDELVQSYKNKQVIIPLEQRIEIIKAIRYVDEVVPISTLDKMDSWKKYHYNKLFIGDDWKGSERWIRTEQEMNKVGVEVVFFPYTQGINSTAIREKLSLNKTETDR